MKKTCNKNMHNLMVSILVAGLCFFNSGCGLDTFEVIDSPVTVYNYPESNTEYEGKYFEFLTNERNSSYYSSIVFLGTDVYYKIYNNENTALSERSNLVNLANSSETSANATSRMIDSYGYKTLKAPDHYGAVLIPATGSNQRVYIRLTSYQDLTDFSARITVNGVSMGRPLRFEDDLNFEFGRSSVNNKSKIPQSGNEDVKYSSSGNTDGKWYVNLFAVGVGRDVAYSNNMSNILSLGTVYINENNLDN